MPHRPRTQPHRSSTRQLPWLLLVLLLVTAACTSGEDGGSDGGGDARPEREDADQTDPLAQPPVWEDPVFGLHMDLTYDSDPERRQEAIELAESVGAQISRNSFLWHRMQPSADAEIDWSRTDAIVQELTERGIEPMFTAYGSPAWLNGQDPEVEDAHLYVPQDDAAFAEWTDRYAEFMRAAAARYRDTVTKWEVWNEPNESFFWKPHPDVERYAEFFQTVRGAILEGNPDAQIAPGGLAALAASGNGISGVDFLRQLLDLGIRPDYVSIHPYASQGQGPEEYIDGQNNFRDIQLIRDVLVEAGHEVPVWVTEWGWESGEVGEETQAQYLERSLEMLAENYRYVTVATYFLDHDRTEFTQGLFSEDLEPKPAAEVFRSFMAGRTQE